MTFKRIDERFAVAPQISPNDIPSIAEAGFRKIISNRPDGEEADQPTAAEIKAAAERSGIAFEHIPVAGGSFSPEQVDAFRQARKSADGPVLAYCRTGNRSITLDSLANVDGLSVEDRLTRAASVGYDISGQRARLEQSSGE